MINGPTGYKIWGPYKVGALSGSTGCTCLWPGPVPQQQKAAVQLRHSWSSGYCYCFFKFCLGAVRRARRCSFASIRCGTMHMSVQFVGAPSNNRSNGLVFNELPPHVSVVQQSVHFASCSTNPGVSWCSQPQRRASEFCLRHFAVLSMCMCRRKIYHFFEVRFVLGCGMKKKVMQFARFAIAFLGSLFL